MQLDKMTGLADMTEIAEIDEHGINLNLKIRYHQDIIYTYTGSILIAVNPYKQLSIFSKDYVLKYHAQKFRNLEPHVFALAEAAYRSIIEDKTNQSCVISGESGAGKTETTKFILQYLCAVTSDVSTWVQQQILEANTILEAFGNAKTVRNDNSSRFGKFMQVCFDAKHTIKGCIVQDYLLEQSRITFQSPGERNYHVLYQLVAQGQKNAEMAKTFHLRNLDFYQYLNVSGNAHIDLEAEAKKFESLTMAFTVLQIPQISIDGVLRVLSAILWLGNMGFGDVDGEHCELQEQDKEICTIIANLLGLKDEEITHVSLHRQINVRGNITEIPLKLQEARENRHAMAKALYSRTFAWLMSKINTCTNPGQDSKLFLGVLDIFGFENFAKNSFEQLCINYTNEKLHKFFNHYVFALEQEIYKLEEIMFAHVEFTDNSLCLELIEKPPRCIFKLLTEQCHMPKGSDLAYLTNMHSEFEFNPYYVKGNDRRHWETEFGVKHYAGSVLYAIDGFVEKNRDVQQDVLFDFMSRSDNTFMQELGSFQDQQTLCSATMQRGTSKTKYTVSDNFRQQLQALIDVLQNTRPWYVRCIKPNSEKLPNTYDEKFVLDQLKYLGMIDIVRIRREGYPIHLNLHDFVTNYKCLVRNNSIEYSREKIPQIMEELKVAQTEWQIGKTKLFLRSRAYECLEEKRKFIVNKNALIIQKTWRGHVARKHYVAVRTAALKIQHAYKGWKLRIKFLRMRRAAIIIQSHLRGVFAREVAAALRELRSVNEEMKKREKLALAKQQKEQERLQLKQQQQQEQLQTEREDSSQTEEDYSSTKELDDCERLVQQEMIELSHMADQINNKFSNDLRERERSAENSGDGTKLNGNQLTGHESVDLDNLFAFLSEVASTNSATNLLAEEIDKMDDLMQDLDKELTHKCLEVSKENGLKLSPKISHLPEPALPPPPPPVIIAPPVVNNSKGEQKPEPIYEAVIPHYTAKPAPIPKLPPVEEIMPKKDIIAAVESPKYASTPLSAELPTPPPLTPTHPTAALTTTTTQNAITPTSTTKVPTKEITPEQTIAPTPTTTTLTNSHTNNNNNNIVNNNNNNNNKMEMHNEREQRRKHRVEKKLSEMNTTNDMQKDMLNNDMHYDIMEFADNYFNTHQRTPEGTIIATLTRKNKICLDIPLQEMISFHKGDKIPTSHIHMYDPENVHLACAIFRELSKYMRGELNPERELQAIQYIIGLGIDRDELRDEIFVQCMRQTTNNANTEWTDRLWLLMCLIIVAFQPSKLLFRYYVSFLKKNLENLDGKLRQYAQWCFDNCKCTKVSARIHPPSSVEVAAMRRLGTIVCRFFFLDGRTKAIDVHPTDTAGDAVYKLADKLNLTNTEGWAIFQSRPDGEEHIKSYDYLYDIIAAWELKQVKGQTNTVNNRRLLTGQGSGENRFVFKKRLFKSTRELSQDPVEVNMLYAQAVYSVVKCDEFPVSEKVALQLAGLQAQVALGDPSIQINPEYYADINNFLPERISKTREPQFWIPILAQAHRQFGSSRNELTAKVLYLSCVMQYPLYGTTMFPVIYKGYWNFGSNIILGVSCEGIMFIQPDEHKTLICQFKYADIESIMLDPSDSFITITLNRMAHHQIYGARAKEFNMPQDIQGCFVFETAQKNEIGSLIVSYCPNLSNWILNNSENPKKHKGLTNEDRTRLYQNVVLCRRQLIDLDVLRKPQETGGFLRNTLRRFSKQRLEKLRAEQRSSIQDHGENYKGFSYSFWAFSRQPIAQCISKFSSDQDETHMLQIFQSILTYAGLGLTGETVQRAEDEHITIVQTILEKCMRKDAYINELFLMLVKQTTDHPDPNSRVNLRHWALLTLACSVILPPLKSIRRYLISHLKRCASDYATEEGKYARFAEKCFFKTQSTRRRQNRPSREEIICTINRRPCYARFYFMDGKFYSIEFQPSSTAFEVMEIIKKKIGLRENSMGYAIYEVLGPTERSLLAEEKLTDVMAKWEKNRVTSAQAQQNNTNNCRHQHYMFLFKKHLFLNNFINMDDPVEKELLYHQILHSLRSERFPITEMEAIMLTAIQAQLEYGDCGESLYDYRIVASHCLPPRFVPNIPHEAVAMHHQSLRGMAPAETKKSFLNLIQSWPLHRATIFDVTQTFTSNWPRNLWLAVDRNGIHLLEHRSRNVLCTHDYDSIMSYSPNMNSLMVITGTDKKPSKVILNTTQPFQIATLIKEYSQIVKTPSDIKK